MGFRTHLIHLLQAKAASPEIAFSLLVDASLEAPTTRPEGPSADAALLWRAQISPQIEVEYAAYEPSERQPSTEKLLVTRLKHDPETGALDEQVLLQLTRTKGDETTITHMSPSKADICEINRAMYRQISAQEKNRAAKPH
jgi:hypothetical protein